MAVEVTPRDLERPLDVAYVAPNGERVCNVQLFGVVQAWSLWRVRKIQWLARATRESVALEMAKTELGEASMLNESYWRAHYG